MESDEKSYNFNGQDYDFEIRLYNGSNDVKLTNTAWESLVIEEDIFDWKIKGSIVVKSPYESLERESLESMVVTGQSKEKLVYKFRNDCRDTLYIRIKPKIDGNDPNSQNYIFDDEKWLFEFEAVVYEVEDMSNLGITEKRKKLYFWEKTFQLMLEKDSDYSTANTGDNKNKENLDQQDNSEKTLKPSDALGELLKNDNDFKKHAKLVGTEQWETGSEEIRIYYTSPIHAKFIDDMNYILNYTTGKQEDDFQPCILKFERATKKGEPKQFSLKPIKQYFKNAGNTSSRPKDYQIEHFFIQEISDSTKTPPVRKSPLSKSAFTEIKADEYNTIRDYTLKELSGIDYSKKLVNYRVASYSSTRGQFNEETEKHKAEEYKEFYKKTIKTNILTNQAEDRLVLTPYIRDGENTRVVFSYQRNDVARLCDGRNKLLKYYLFSNLAMSFSTRGSTLRQPGRFFAVSKQNLNDKEYDHKLEGQYFVVNVIHLFQPDIRSYTTQLMGIKTHTYKELTQFESDDVNVIGA